MTIAGGNRCLQQPSAEVDLLRYPWGGRNTTAAQRAPHHAQAMLRRPLQAAALLTRVGRPWMPGPADGRRIIDLAHLGDMHGWSDPGGAQVALALSWVLLVGLDHLRGYSQRCPGRQRRRRPAGCRYRFCGGGKARRSPGRPSRRPSSGLAGLPTRTSPTGEALDQTEIRYAQPARRKRTIVIQCGPKARCRGSGYACAGELRTTAQSRPDWVHAHYRPGALDQRFFDDITLRSCLNQCTLRSWGGAYGSAEYFLLAAVRTQETESRLGTMMVSAAAT